MIYQLLCGKKKKKEEEERKRKKGGSMLKLVWKRVRPSLGNSHDTLMKLEKSCCKETCLGVAALVQHVKDSVFMQLWHRFDPWPGNLHITWGKQKKQKNLFNIIYCYTQHISNLCDHGIFFNVKIKF